MIFLAVGLWVFIGFTTWASVITKHRDFVVKDLWDIALLSTLGPLLYLLVSYHNNKIRFRTWRRNLGAKVIFKKRGSDD